MPSRLTTIRERAAEHQEELDSARWFTAQRLAARWDVAVSTVYEIPFAELKYKEFGGGKKLKRRRYKPEWVEAYEANTDRAPREPRAKAKSA